MLENNIYHKLFVDISVCYKQAPQKRTGTNAIISYVAVSITTTAMKFYVVLVKLRFMLL